MYARVNTVIGKMACSRMSRAAFLPVGRGMEYESPLGSQPRSIAKIGMRIIANQKGGIDFKVNRTVIIPRSPGWLCRWADHIPSKEPIIVARIRLVLTRNKVQPNRSAMTWVTD